MAFWENPTPVEINEQQTPEQEISNKAVNLNDQLSKLASDNYIKIPENDWSQTRLRSSSHEMRHFWNWWKKIVWPETSFSLKNVQWKNGNKEFIIKVDSYWDLTVNWDNIPAEKAMGILDKVEANINEYKEYKAKKAEEARLKELKDNRKKQEEDNARADKYMNSIDF